MRKLRTGEPVVGKDGLRLGSVERLVVDEQAHRVTHLVIDGHLVGAARVHAFADDRLVADLDAETLHMQPRADAAPLSEPAPHWRAPGGYSLTDFLRIASALIGQTPYVPPVHLDLDLSSVHELKAGSPVWSGGVRVGEVSEVLTSGGDRVAALVVQRPGVLGVRHVVPVSHVAEVVGTNVHLDLSEQELDALPDPSV